MTVKATHHTSSG